MKKGCIFKAFLYFVLVAAVILYLAEKYGKVFFEESKDKIKQSFIEQVEAQVKGFAKSDLTDSLSSSFEKKVEELKLNRDLDSEKFDELIGELKSFIDTNRIDAQISSKLKEIITNYEQREKK